MGLVAAGGGGGGGGGETNISKYVNSFIGTNLKSNFEICSK